MTKYYLNWHHSDLAHWLMNLSIKNIDYLFTNSREKKCSKEESDSVHVFPDIRKKFSEIPKRNVEKRKIYYSKCVFVQFHMN